MRVHDNRDRWLEIATSALSGQADQDPMARVCRELFESLAGAIVGIVDYSPSKIHIAHYMWSDTIDPEYYAANFRHHPLCRHYVETGEGVRTTAEADPFLTDSAAQFLARAATDGIHDFIFVPLITRPEYHQRWLVIGTTQRLHEDGRALCERVADLVRAIDRRAQKNGARATDLLDSRATTKDPLTLREVAVLGLLSQGLTAEAIGRRLRISGRTVSKHLERVYTKLNTHDRLTTVLTARRMGILPI